jgi:hypothetical protein
MGDGIAAFEMGAQSTMGLIAVVGYNTAWYNWDTFISGYVSGTDFPVSMGWARTRVASTGSGYVSAVMTGGATLVWGGYCKFLSPFDARTIS